MNFGICICIQILPVSAACFTVCWSINKKHKKLIKNLEAVELKLMSIGWTLVWIPTENWIKLLLPWIITVYIYFKINLTWNFPLFFLWVDEKALLAAVQVVHVVGGWGWVGPRTHVRWGGAMNRWGSSR